MRLHENFKRKTKKDEVFYQNTIKRAKEWIKYHFSMENVNYIEDNDKIIIVKIKVSLNKYHIEMATRNILQLLLNKDLVLCIDSTYKYS